MLHSFRAGRLRELRIVGSPAQTVFSGQYAGFGKVPMAVHDIPVQANSDEELATLWLNTYSPVTRDAYGPISRRFRASVGLPLREVTISDLQRFSASLKGKPRTVSLHIATVRSLFRFAKEIGYLDFDPATSLRFPTVKKDLAERILLPGEVMRLFDQEPDPRNLAMLKLFYSTGIRVSELTALSWRDFRVNNSKPEFMGQVTVMGKGGKTRSIAITHGVWAAVMALKEDTGPDAPVFRSRKGGRLHRSQVLRIVREAASRAGIRAPNVSPHWLRHCHASHALENGAPLPLVQATLGHASAASTSAYLHARPGDSSSRYLPQM